MVIATYSKTNDSFLKQVTTTVENRLTIKNKTKGGKI